MQNRGYRWAFNEEVAERMARNEPAGFGMTTWGQSELDVREGPHDRMAKHVFVCVRGKVPRREPYSLFQGALAGAVTQAARRRRNAPT